ncbi:MAG: 3' terminal RNA ribose 2'-O-methyltransferase Hen1 [Synergistaceae bacterium]|jgi:3' terminal RNA ribose 2'-O-methyltransferase Hen1|nr:3' terminal RNA ribose 2'-O-methyltransferase Hen1 [Synergistaceae bacterium]
MLLTITHTGANATDLGYLLHKNPHRPQAFELSFGKAYVFYPEKGENRCTAALLLDIDPIDLARGKAGSKNGLFDYVNDRPYVCSSFMSTAISRVYGTAMSGRCEQRPDLAGSAIELSATVAMLPCRKDASMLERVFSPLGYSVEFASGELDGLYPEWGASPYVDLTLSGTVRLKDLLLHLYVLIPVFDRQKHYWVGEDEIEKLLCHGKGWLEGHPEREFIVRGYFNRRKQYLARLALERLDDGEGGARDEMGKSGEEETDRQPSLNKRRLEAVVAALKDNGAASVIDMGCGEGNLLRLLLKERSFAKVAGTDLSLSALERAGRRIRLDRLPETLKNRVTVFQSSLTYRDGRFSGYDAAACVEVIEHIDRNRLPAFERVLFGCAKPRVIVLTTPNVEYNENYEFLGEGLLRHGDHRFEWTRGQFREWGDRTAQKHGYSVSYSDIGDADGERGAPTQMGVFVLCKQSS